MTAHDISQGMKKGALFVVSAPSGAGKTTLCNMMRKRFPDIAYSISHTTRPPRKGEKNGVDYYFISKDEFETRIKNRRWVEWAKVHDNYYGTSLDFIESSVNKGKILLLDIDVQGAKQIKSAFPDAVTIFIMPPSFEVLENRLKERGTDGDEVIARRLENALAEMEEKAFYDHVIVNDDLDTAEKEMGEIFIKRGGL